VDNYISKKVFLYIVLVLFAISGILFASILYDSNRTAKSESRDVIRTVQSTEKSVQSAQDEIGNARGELSDGQETIGNLEESNRESGQLITECKQLIGNIEREFADIDRANKLPNSQDSN